MNVQDPWKSDSYGLIFKVNEIENEEKDARNFI